MDIFGPTSLKIRKLNIYRHRERIKLRKKKDSLLLFEVLYGNTIAIS